MCGRYTLRTKLNLAIQDMKVDHVPDYALRYNIAPTQSVPVMRQLDGHWNCSLMRWGLIPSWAKEIPKLSLINARADTVAEKPSFRTAFKKRRCLIPTDGWYEWQATGGPKKQPFLIHARGDKPFFFAGLWEQWFPEKDKPVDSCTIITTDASEFTKSIHDRMPVVLDKAAWKKWLAPDAAPENLKALLQPSDKKFVLTPVSTIVNSPKNDVAECVEPIKL